MTPRDYSQLASSMVDGLRDRSKLLRLQHAVGPDFYRFQFNSLEGTERHLMFRDQVEERVAGTKQTRKIRTGTSLMGFRHAMKKAVESSLTVLAQHYVDEKKPEHVLEIAALRSLVLEEDALYCPEELLVSHELIVSCGLSLDDWVPDRVMRIGVNVGTERLSLWLDLEGDVGFGTVQNKLLRALRKEAHASQAVGEAEQALRILAVAAEVEAK
jgi:hypothetical protein